MPRAGTIILPGRTFTAKGRIDAPYPRATLPADKTVKVFFEVNRAEKGDSWGDLRRTIVIDDPNLATSTTVAIPYGSKRLNFLPSTYGAAALPNGTTIQALAKDGTVIADYSGVFFRGVVGQQQSGTAVGLTGVEIPANAVSLKITGAGGAAAGYISLVFHLDP